MLRDMQGSRSAAQVSTDGKGCWRDNVFVERLWKSVKYEEIYLHGYDTVSVGPARLDPLLRFLQSAVAAFNA